MKKKSDLCWDFELFNNIYLKEQSYSTSYEAMLCNGKVTEAEFI